MLDETANRRLSEVGRGTPMGELLRRYLHPIGAVGELDDHPTKPVRLMGEDLVLYRDLLGTYGLIDRHFPHRPEHILRVRSDKAVGTVLDGRGTFCIFPDRQTGDT